MCPQHWHYSTTKKGLIRIHKYQPNLAISRVKHFKYQVLINWKLPQLPTIWKEKNSQSSSALWRFVHSLRNLGMCSKPMDWNSAHPKERVTCSVTVSRGWMKTWRTRVAEYSYKCLCCFHVCEWRVSSVPSVWGGDMQLSRVEVSHTWCGMTPFV